MPTAVWEVQADSFTLSKSHTAGRTTLKQHAETAAYLGLSMRFPRFIRVRDDKAVRISHEDYLNQIKSEDTEVGTTVEEILRMYFG